MSGIRTFLMLSKGCMVPVRSAHDYSQYLNVTIQDFDSVWNDLSIAKIDMLTSIAKGVNGNF